MNEKKEKRYKVAIVVLVIICVVSIGIAIYLGRSGSVDYANELRSIITELRAEYAEQGATLAHVIDELQLANREAAELRDNNGRALDVARGTNERIAEFERAMAGAGTTIDGLIERQRIINEFVGGLWADYRQLRAALGERQ